MFLFSLQVLAKIEQADGDTKGLLSAVLGAILLLHGAGDISAGRIASSLYCCHPLSVVSRPHHSGLTRLAQPAPQP